MHLALWGSIFTGTYPLVTAAVDNEAVRMVADNHLALKIAAVEARINQGVVSINEDDQEVIDEQNSIASTFTTDTYTDTESSLFDSSFESENPKGIVEENDPQFFKSVFEDIPFLSKRKNIHDISAAFRSSLETTILQGELPSYGEYNIVLGTGLKCLQARSAGVPFDVLGFISVAESVREKFGFKKIIHYIGDTHAGSCGFNQTGFASLEDLNEEANRQKSLYEMIAYKLGIQESYSVLLASEFQSTSDFLRIKNKVFAESQLESETDYTKLEIADIEFFRKHMDTKIKISWVMHDDEKREAKRDECLYDRLYKDVFSNEDMTFLYARSGINLSGHSLETIDASPYSYPNADVRITLRPIDNNPHLKITTFSERFEEEKKLKNKYVDKFVRFLKSKCGNPKERMDIFRQKIKREMDTSYTDSLMLREFDDESSKVYEAAKTILVEYGKERDRSRQESRKLLDKVLEKYRAIVEGISKAFPAAYEKTLINEHEGVGIKVQKIIQYITVDNDI